MSLWNQVHPEVLLAAGYALFLLLAAAGLELLARATQKHVAGRKAIGFRYRQELNAWQCSEGYFLWLRETDHRNRIARYRAHAHTCNKCAAKHLCTDSNEGRELVRSLDDSPGAELGQFQRGLSLMLLALAAVVLVVEGFRHHQHAELLLLAAAFGPLLALSRRALRRLFKWGRYVPQPEL
jgi:hypothetical protein